MVATMMELIDRQAFIADKQKQYCENCERRKGKKNGRYVVLYDIGEAPCRSCSICDMLDDLEDYPTVEERKQGEWKCSQSMSHIYSYDRVVTSFESNFTCDCCGWTLRIGTDGNNEVDEIPLNFCPNCGASMRAVKDER